MSINEDMILLPIITLASWSLVMGLWMFLTRIPAMTKAKVSPDQAKHTSNIQEQLPSSVRAIGDNYSNLFELPIVFYVVSVTIFLAGHVDMIAIYLAWGFVGFRILHSIIQSTYNAVMHRFGAFLIAMILLVALAVRELLNLI